MRRWLLILLAFLLPLQALAGMVMPVSHGAGLVLVAAPAGDASHDGAGAAGHHPCHDPMDMSAALPPMPESPAHDSHGLGCDACGLCHMASSGFAPASSAPAAGPLPGDRWLAAPLLSPRSFVPPLLDRPPLAAAV